MHLQLIMYNISNVGLSQQDILKKMRILDDKIVYTLNTSLPTESFQNKINPTAACQELYEQIKKGHSERENVIKNCIIVTADTVKNLKAAKEQKPDDIDVLKNLKTEQRKVIHFEVKHFNCL